MAGSFLIGRGPDDRDLAVAVTADGAIRIAADLQIPEHDYGVNTYDASNNLLSTVYRLGGPEGTIVATVTMTYDAEGNMLTFHRTLP
jgi:hypothetical protein